MVKSTQWSVQERPKRLEDFVGQPAAVAWLRGLIKTRRIPGCMLVTGASGSGKTTFARLAAALFSGWRGDPDENPDAVEIPGNVDRTIDDVRGFIVQSRYNPRGQRRCMIVDEAQGLVGPAASALLKATEEPPPRTTWILCTDQPEKLPRQMTMRGARVSLGIVTDAELTSLLKSVLKRNRRDLGRAEDEILRRIVQSSYGVPRQAIQLLDSVATSIAGGGRPSEALKLALRNESAVDSFDTAMAFVSAYVGGDVAGALKVVRATGTGDGVLEVMIRVLPELAYVANGDRPKNGIGWAAAKALKGRPPLPKILELQKRVVAALSIRVQSNYQVPAEALLAALADQA